MKQLTLALVARLNRLRRKHQRKGVENIVPSLGTSAPLAEDPRHSWNRRNRPAVIALLINDGQVELGHADNDTRGLRLRVRA
jgi:hypothetical protein